MQTTTRTELVRPTLPATSEHDLTPYKDSRISEECNRSQSPSFYDPQSPSLQQKLSTEQSLQISSSRKSFKMPPAFDHVELLKVPSKQAAQGQSIESATAEEQVLKHPPSAMNTSVTREVRTSPESKDRPKISDFSDKESDAFKSFLEQRRKAKNKKSESRFGQPWNKDEDDLLLYLKGDCDLPWPTIAEHFPGRTRESLQVHWSSKLARHHPNARRKGPRTQFTKAAETFLRSSRTKRPTQYTFDPLPDADVQSCGASTPVQGPIEDAHSSSDSDRQIVQLYKGGDQKSLHRSRESERSSSVDSLLGSPEKESDRFGRESYALSPYGRFKSSQVTVRESTFSITNDPVFDFINQTQFQIDQEKERRRNIPRRRASNRSLFLRPRVSSSEPPYDLQADQMSRRQVALDASGHKAFKSSVRSRQSPPYPYLSFSERRVLLNSSNEVEWDRNQVARWRGVAIHVDFMEWELYELKHCLISAASVIIQEVLPLFDQLQDAGRQLAKDDVALVASYATKRPALKYRTTDSIGAFLEDLSTGTVAKQPTRRYIGPAVVSCSPSHRRGNISSMLQDRELGRHSQRTQITETTAYDGLRTCMLDTIGPSCSFTGTSGDVHTVVWAPNGSIFAAGSVATTDSNSMQYNRPNNLLMGDTEKRTLYELPKHAIDRPCPQTGVNASEAMRATQDPRLFTTVTMVAFSPDGSYMFSAGYDNCVRVWEFGSGLERATCTNLIKHKAPVDVMAVSDHGVLATGSQRIQKSIKTIVYDSSGLKRGRSYESSKAVRKPETEIFPSCLKWGVHWAHSKFLLAGFASNTPDGKLDAYGETCLWNVETEQQLYLIKNTPAVYDCAWNPIPSRRGSFFAVASAAPLQGVNRGTNSIIRFYDPATPTWDKHRCTDEFECPAYDMNDVIWCPYDENLIATSCTNGKTYLWDIRNRHLLSTLKHGNSLMPLDEFQRPELVDTGVRFTSWGPCRERLFTGASDGLVSAWNPYVAPEDMHVRDLVQLNSGIMCGAFSPDYSNLLVGEVDGSINLLSVGDEDRAIRDMAKFKIESSPLPLAGNPLEREDSTVGVKSANELVSSGAINLKPMGSFPIRQAVQGPVYGQSGFVDHADDAFRLRDNANTFQADLAETENNEEPCQLHTDENLYQYTEEECPDSKRSQDRIPHRLRLAAKKPRFLEMELQEGVPAAMKRCSGCGKAARPRSELDVDDKLPLCELCSFTCLRCSEPATIGSLADTLNCTRCEVVWRADILGFSVQEQHRVGRMNAVISNMDTQATEDQGADEASEEPYDEVVDYYHTLWEDRADSPL